MKERAKLLKVRKSNKEHDVSVRLSSSNHADNEMQIDAGAGSKMRKGYPPKVVEERKEPHKNPFHMDKQM